MKSTKPKRTNKEVRQSNTRWADLRRLQRNIVGGVSTQIGGVAILLNNRPFLLQMEDRGALVYKIFKIYETDYNFFLDEMDKLKDRFADKKGRVMNLADNELYQEISMLIEDLHATTLAITTPHTVKLTELVYLTAMRVAEKDPSPEMDELVSRLEITAGDTKNIVQTVGEMNAKLHSNNKEVLDILTVSKDIVEIAETVVDDLSPVQPINFDLEETVTEPTEGEVTDGK